MTPLYELPNGEYIDLECVTYIGYGEPVVSNEGPTHEFRHGHRVILHMYGRREERNAGMMGSAMQTLVLQCDSEEQAKRRMKMIFNACNEARKSTPDKA